MAAKVILLAVVAAFAVWAWLEDDVPTEYGIGAGFIGLLVAISGRWISPPRSPGT